MTPEPRAGDDRPLRIAVSIHDPPVWSIPPAQVDRIVRARPHDEIVDARDAATRREAFAGADVLFATRLRPEEFAVAGCVRWIQSSAVGVGGLLVPGLVSSDVVVTNAKGVHSEAIAEHAVALLLAVRRSLHVAVTRQAARDWAQAELANRRVPVASGTEVLVIGLGSIGSRVAVMCAGLGMRVVGIRRHVAGPVPAGVALVRPPDELPAALATADAVVLALPRTEHTQAIIGAAEIDRMKPSAILVNVARGRLVDDDALVTALEQGRIAGAGLDAFQPEPLPADSPYWRLPNVLVSPHTASFAGDYWAPVVDLFLLNLQRFSRGEPLVNVVDKHLGY